MQIAEQQTMFYQRNKLFLSKPFSSKEEFVSGYKRFYHEKSKAEELYVVILTQLKKAISEGNFDSFKKLSNLIDYINDIEDQVTLRNYYDNAINPIRSTNLVILACKHNKVKILKYLLDSDRRILNNLSIGIRRATILPGDEDETRHNALYYAIRSGNIELLDILINQWLENYFAAHLEKFDVILSTAYEELKLMNVPLSDEIQIFVENKLISLRFFSNTSGQNQNFKSTNLNNIKKRIDLTLQNISLLKTEYSNMEEVDEKFIFVAKFIAHNISTLKRQLKSTYDRLPWEEIEFCLVIFVFSYTRRQEINLFYKATLNKSKILNHLDNFAKELENVKHIIKDVNIGKLAVLPKLNREKAIEKINSSIPQFEELYCDYQQIRDIYSLEKIGEYIKLASSANPKEREGQLIIIRALQVIGEHLKNTHESPKLSNSMSEYFLLMLPKNTRTFIVGIRNSLSHAHSLSKSIDNEETTDVQFFINIQNDTKKIGGVIINILYNNKIKIIRTFLEKIVNSENFDKISEIAEVLSSFELEKMNSENLIILELEKLQKYIKILSDYITNKTNDEIKLFDKINSIIVAGTQSEDIKTDYITAVRLLKTASIHCNIANKTEQNVIKIIKHYASQILKTITSKIVSRGFQEIAKLLKEILITDPRSRIHPDQIGKVELFICKICCITDFGADDIQWIKKLRTNLTDQCSLIADVNKEKYNNQLAPKLAELKSILNKTSLIDTVLFYKRDKNMQSVVEMLVLDIMSILSSSKHYLENNVLFLDDNSPLLTGKCLRNYLAHDNTVVDALLLNPSIGVILNAVRLTEEQIMVSKQKIGKFVSDDPVKLKEKYDQSLAKIAYQKKMFVALKEGRLEIVKDCLKNGVDINTRSIHSWTALHFAAGEASFEAVKFLLDQNLSVYVKDIDGQSPLHVAAAHGRKNIVEFFISETHLNIDDLNQKGKTPLHFAAQNGHKDIVKVLLKNKAYTLIQDMVGLLPVHYAVMNNHIEVVKILLEKEGNVDSNETENGDTLLYIAADNGNLKLVNFLLQHKADVNARNNQNWTPLCAAVCNGHLEVTNALILYGADVNTSVINGCTPLYFAVESGRVEIANILLKHGADVNAVTTNYNNTPLHHAAWFGQVEIVKILLENKANANVINVQGETPLHLAVQYGHLEVVADFLKNGVDVNPKEINNATPLYYAAEYGHNEIAKLLIKYNAEVNAKTIQNLTPLHAAAGKGNKDIIDILIKNQAAVNAQTIQGFTPLHLAAVNGSKNVIDLLIKNNAEVNTKSNNGITPLHQAAINGHEDAVVLLIKNKAEVNIKADDGDTPLHLAIIKGHAEIVNLLIKNKAYVNVRDMEEITHTSIKVKDNIKKKSLLSLAAFFGYTDIVEILLKNNWCVNIKDIDNITPLHSAVSGGHGEIIKALLENGADVDAVTIDNVTPLLMAAVRGCEKIVKNLIAAGANINAKTNEGHTPLHNASISGYSNIVKILLDNKAVINVKDNQNTTPLELAVSHGHIQVVKILLQYKKIDMSTKYKHDDKTLLHIASQESNLNMVKYLVDEGSNINSKNAFGLKPIHVAGEKGHRETVQYFLSQGLCINDTDGGNQTLLHYATMKGHFEIVKYLIAQGCDVNVKDAFDLTPMHNAAKFGNKEVIEVLLKNGAVYNAVNTFYKTPLEMSKDEDIINLLELTAKLFKTVKNNNSSEVDKCIKAGAFVNAKNAAGITPLHYAAWKGYDNVVLVLLKNKGNPNAVGNKGTTPLHYAAKFAHLKVVQTLLSNSAIYNAVSDGGKTPSDFSADERITSLLKLVNESFESIKNDNSQVIQNLNKITDMDTIKVIMRAHNRENKTLVAAATLSNFSEVKQLKEILQGNISAQIDIAKKLTLQGNCQQALSIFTSAYEKRQEILGSDNPATLEIQAQIAYVLHIQENHQEALNAFKQIYRKQKKILGLNNKETLNTRSAIALSLHSQGKTEEALNICEEVYQKQMEILGPNDLDTLITQFYMGSILSKLGKYKEALNSFKTNFEKRKEILGANHPTTVDAQNQLAKVLTSHGSYEESLKIYKEVLEKTKTALGINNYETLRILHDIAGVLFNQKKYPESLKAYQEVLKLQETVLGPNHTDTLRTQYHMGNALFNQGKWIPALGAYVKGLDQLKTDFGPSHPNVLNILRKIKMLNIRFNFKNSAV